MWILRLSTSPQGDVTVRRNPMRLGAPLAAAAALLMAACTSAPNPVTSSGTSAPTQLSAQVASYDLVAHEPNRVLLGVFSTDGVVSYGSISVTFAYMGTATHPAPTPQGPFETTAHFVLVPAEASHAHEGEGEEADEGNHDGETTTLYTDDELQAAADRPPELTEPTDAKGVYQATDVVFDDAGFWQASITVTYADGSTAEATAAFEVVDKPQYPAIGSKAPASDNLVMEDIGGKVTAISVDSRAIEAGEVPDPSLHDTTVKAALAAGEPMVVVVSTPSYCQSRFCGPITDEIQALQETYGDKARFIHLELWNEFQKKAINKAASQWVYRDGGVTEPWVFLVGSDGTISDRWSNVLDPRELAAQLDALP